MLDNPLLIAFLLIILAFGIAVLELFIPSNGILGFLAIASLVASILFAFRHNNATGFSFVAIAIIGVPLTAMLLIRWWPNTTLGKKIAPEITLADDMLPDQGNLKALIGMIGEARSVMLPSGPVKIEGRTIDAMSEGIPIEKGQAVKVIAVRGNHIIVRPVDEAAEDSDKNSPNTDENAKDILSQPIDSLGIDPLDDPLA